MKPETQTKRQVTQNGCLHSLLGYKKRDKGIEKVYGEENNTVFCTGLTRLAQAEHKYLVPVREAQRTNREGTLFHLSSLSLNSPKFQQSAGANLSSLSLRMGE